MSDIHPDALGGYYWAGLTKDGREINQIYVADAENEVVAQRSVDVLRSEEVARINLVPQAHTHVPVQIEVGQGEDWIKHWTRQVQFSDRGEQVGEIETVDTVGLQTRSGDRVYLHIYADGSIRVTTNQES